MSNNAMSNETDLDWLARNVHVWPESSCSRLLLGSTLFNTGWEFSYGQVRKGRQSFTKQQWLDRRAELQNKPSWEDHPDAKCFVQHSDGSWFKNTESSNASPSGNGWINDDRTCGWVELTEGEVLGDWRNTLERRPERTRSEMEVELVKAAFKPFTSIEDNQELNVSNKQEVKQDNGWFERGELPPVGVVCETLAEPELQWVAAEVVAHRDGFVIAWVTSEKCGAQCDDPKHFRPIRTERELAIEEMQRIIDECNESHPDNQLGALYDAGYRKESK